MIQKSNIILEPSIKNHNLTAENYDFLLKEDNLAEKLWSFDKRR